MSARVLRNQDDYRRWLAETNGEGPEPIVDDGESAPMPLGMRTWDPSPQALERIAARANQIEHELRTGTGRFAC